MRMYLISDNTDTLTGMRLAGVDGVIANEKGTLEKALNEVLKDKNIGIILLTETLGKKYPELVKTVRTAGIARTRRPANWDGVRSMPPRTHFTVMVIEPCLRCDRMHSGRSSTVEI